MGLANSTYLFGLLGFIVPIVIHLLNKKEGKVMAIGSIQFMPEAESTHSSSLHLNEYVLLLLRCLLLALISILMAGLLLPEKEIEKKAVVLIDPFISNDARVIRALDTLDNYEKRWLQNGLPLVQNVPADTSQFSSVWELNSQINQLNTDGLTIFSPLNISWLKGKRPSVNKTINFIGVGELDSKSYLFQAFKIGTEQQLIIGKSNSLKTEYELLNSSKVKGLQIKNDSIGWNNGAMIPLMKFDTIYVNIVTDKGFERDKKYLEAALRAITDYSGFPIKIVNNRSIELTKKNDWTFWLSTKKLPSIKGKVLSLRDNRFEHLINKSGKGNYFLNAHLNSNNIIEQNLASQLLHMLFNLYQNDHEDARQVAVGQISPRLTHEQTAQGLKPTNQHWLWLLLGILFFSERTLSMVRNQ